MVQRYNLTSVRSEISVFGIITSHHTVCILYCFITFLLQIILYCRKGRKDKIYYRKRHENPHCAGRYQSAHTRRVPEYSISSGRDCKSYFRHALHLCLCYYNCSNTLVLSEPSNTLVLSEPSNTCVPKRLHVHLYPSITCTYIPPSRALTSLHTHN